MIEQILESGLSMELFEKLYDETEEMTFQKGELLLDHNEHCRYIYIVQEGLLRMFYFDDKGNDITHWIATEQNLMSSPESFFEGSRSQYLIEALEDTIVRALTLDSLNDLCGKHHEIERFGRLLTLRMFMEVNKKLMDIQFKTGKQRYDALLSSQPDIFQRVKLGHIATYLGMTQVSLSRIRSEK